MTHLQVSGVDKSFGGLRVLSDVELTADSGAVTALIGPNGAGKSTLVNIVTGFTRPDSGRVVVDGVDVTGLPAHRRAALGIGRSFQNLALFHGSDVTANVVSGRYRLGGRPGWLRGPRRSDQRWTADTLTGVGLRRLARADVDSLSYGQAKVVESARLLAMEPTLVVMDEPAAGLTADETDELGARIAGVAEAGVAVLLVEHHMGLVMSIADHVVVLDHGVVIARGTPEEIRRDPAVLAAYLGPGETA
jgi:branched-chain amino acid transport system ATP-binding protein